MKAEKFSVYIFLLVIAFFICSVLCNINFAECVESAKKYKGAYKFDQYNIFKKGAYYEVKA